MELSWLEALVIAVENGSFQTAARKLNVSRATLRGRVEALESLVGLPLLVRTVRGVELTDEGRLFLPRARALLAEAAALSRFSEECAAEISGELRIRAPNGLPTMLHTAAISQIRQRYPGVSVRFDLHADPTSEIDPETDFVLHFCPRVTRGDFRTVRLATSPVRLIASPGYLAERGTPQDIAALREHTLLSWLAPGEDGTRWPLRAGGWADVSPAVRSTDIGTLRSLTSLGAGIAFVPDPEEARLFVSREEIVHVLPDVVGQEISLWVLMPDPRAGTGRTRAALQVARDIAEWVARHAPEQP